MALNPGDRLGPYEVLSILGEGGMGRVYRARDTKLQRQVAIKVLPDEVAADPDRVARFEREARTLASLNHPHIAQIYGTEQSGTTHALVMELVEGEDLSQRIARGPIPWREAEPIVKQIAEALETAHEQGIVHRDLKPANIKITPDGVVKVLDFGLAKAVEPGAAPISAENALVNSPTITSPAGVTQAGFILGTVAYMSPEQSKGRPADKRSDVWAFGCVLFEMLSGRRAFPGDDVMETLSAVIRAEPDWNALPKDVPPAIRSLIERCLIKDRRARVSDIGVARYALESDHEVAPAPAAPARTAWPFALIAVASIVAITAVALPRRPGLDDASPPPVVRSTIAAPGAVTIAAATIAMSRQGTHLAYASTQGGIHVRKLSESEARPLQGTEGGLNPFFSDDGESLGFFADGKLKKVPVAGGAAQVIADAPSSRGGSWGRDGIIVFAATSDGGLSKVSAEGGAVTPLTTVKTTERSHRWPHLLPDGRHVVLTIQPAGKMYDDAVIAAVPVRGGEPQVLITGGSGAQYSPSGHLIFAKAGNLLATAFDPVALRTSGAAITVVENVRTNQLNGAALFAITAGGTLLYLPGVSNGATTTLLSATRTGQTQVLLDGRLFDNSFRLSPDGRRVALAITDGQVDLWMVDLDGRRLNRFTFGAGSKSFPVWSPDGSRLYYATDAGGVAQTVTKATDGGSAETVITNYAMFPTSISADGTALSGRAIRSNSHDVISVNLPKKAEAAVVATAANESEPAFSPDGRFIAFQSDETGRPEVFVQAYPSGSTWQVTTTGGSEPKWTSQGREIVYRRGGAIVAAPIILQPFSIGPEQTLFNVPNAFAFDVTADGRRFVIGQDVANRELVDFVLVAGWFDELRTKMQPSR